MILTNLSYHKYDSLSTIYYRYAGKKCIQARRMKARIIRKRFTFCEVWSIIEKDGVFRQKTFFTLCPQKASLKFLKNQQNLLHFLQIYVTIKIRIVIYTIRHFVIGGGVMVLFNDKLSNFMRNHILYRSQLRGGQNKCLRKCA